MNRFFLFLMLIAAFGYSTDATACVAGPIPNSLNVAGPTTVCASDPTASYDLTYSTASDAEPYTLFLAVQGGAVTNIVPYNSIFGTVPTGRTCTPFLDFPGVITDCNIDQVYSVWPNCRGGITFDVAWDPTCPFDLTVQAVLLWGNGQIIDEFDIIIDPSCLTTSDQGNVANIDISPEGASAEVALNRNDFTDTAIKQRETIDIFPNPATQSEVTVLLPSTYENYEIRVNDLNGKLIQQYNNVNGQAIINTDKLEGSVYFIQVVTDGFSETQKLILAK